MGADILLQVSEHRERRRGLMRRLANGRLRLDEGIGEFARLAKETAFRSRLYAGRRNASILPVRGAESYGGLECFTEIKGDVAILRIRGEADLSNAAAIGAYLRKLASMRRSIVVDLSEVAYIDMAGIHELERTAVALRDEERMVVLASPSAICHRLFQIVKPDGIPLFPTKAAALTFYKENGTS